MDPRTKRTIREWTNTVVSTAVMFVVLRAVVVEAYDVPTGSMRPTILEHERILGTKFHYWLWEPERGDVVVFRTPPAVRAMQADGGSDRLLKRIVAVAGDTVEVRDGAVWVNGARQEEPYLLEPPHYLLTPVLVPEHHVFVLGDNRNNSLDGHVWGFLPESALLARGFARYWPPWRIGAL